jgi:hypothetical protein
MSNPPLADADLERLQTLLESVAPPLEPLDISALDGYLCGVLLQPMPILPTQWLPLVADVDGRPAPAGPALDELLEIDVAGGRARKHRPLALDLCGIAKGFGVDELARVLDQRGIGSWLVGIDGEMLDLPHLKRARRLLARLPAAARQQA